MSLKIDEKFAKELSDILKRYDDDLLDDVSIAIDNIEDQFTRGYFHRFMDELNNNGATEYETAGYINSFIKRLNDE